MVYSKWYRKMGQKNKYEYHLNFKHKGKQKAFGLSYTVFSV